jgi:hypothetical protein
MCGAIIIDMIFRKAKADTNKKELFFFCVWQWYIISKLIKFVDYFPCAVC